MVNGFREFEFRPVDFGCKEGDALLQFGHRERVEILPRQQPENVALAATGEKVVWVHGLNVDP